MKRMESDLHPLKAGNDNEATDPIKSSTPRLFVTTENIKQIKKYVADAKNLPKTLPEIHEQIGKLDTPDFNTSHIKDLHAHIYEHAIGWPAIEDGLLFTGDRLAVFAKNLTSFNTQMINTIDAMPIMERLKPYEGAPVEKLPNLDFDASDKEIHKVLGDTFNDIKKSLNKAAEATNTLHAQIQHFTATLEEQLIPNVESCINKLAKISHAEQTERLTLRLYELRRQLQEKNAQKTRLMVDEVIFKAPIYPSPIVSIGYAVKDLICGNQLSPELIEVFTSLAKLRSEINAIEPQIIASEGIPLLVIKHSKSLRTLHSIMKNASDSTSLLKKVWGSIIAHLETSATDFSLITTGQPLLAFRANIERSTTPWSEVAQTVEALLQVLHNANETTR